MWEILDLRLRELPRGAFHDLLIKIGAIDEFKGWWNGRELPSSALLQGLKKQTLEMSARASIRIHDGGSSELRLPSRLRGGARPSPEPDIAQVAAYTDLLRSVFDGYREIRFGEELVLRFHTQLLKNTARDREHRGRYKSALAGAKTQGRRATEPVALRPTAAELIPGQMTALTEWTVSRMASSPFHPLLVIAAFILEFLAVRPFADGNGRLSRILTNLLLLQNGYAYVPYAPLERMIAEQHTEYYLALRRSQASRNLPTPDIAPWLSAFLDAMRAQVRELSAIVHGRPHDQLLSRNQLAVLTLIEGDGEATNRLVRRQLRMPKDTAKQVLNRLIALNLVRRVGAGRAIRYRAVRLYDDGGAAR